MSIDWRFVKYRGSLVRGEWPTIPELLAISVEEFSDKNYFTQLSPETVKFTYREAAEQVDQIAGWLIEKKVKPGDKIALVGKNTPYWALSYFAVLKAGGVVVPFDYSLGDEEINRLIKFVDAKGVIVDAARYDAIKIKGRGLKLSLSQEEKNYIIDLKPSKQVSYPEVDENSLAAILFTSGTTGAEKGVTLTHKNFTSDVYQAVDGGFINASSRDVWYALLPLHHCYCMTAVLLAGTCFGSEIIFQQDFAVSNILKDLKGGKITVFMGVPLLYNKILKGILRKVRERGIVAYLYISLMMKLSGTLKLIFKVNPGKKIFHSLLEKASLDTLRLCISGGGPLAYKTFKQYNQLGLNFIQGYGLTETGPIVTLNPVEKFKIQSVGRVFPLDEVKIVDKDHNGVGEIFIKGPNITGGYYNNEEATEELFSEDGYLKTGDLGFLDRENYLYLKGRKKSLIVTEGGKNIFPEEVEDLFQLYDEVEQVMVKGFLANEESRAEGVEAIILPSQQIFADVSYNLIKERMISIVRELNRKLISYKKVGKIRIINQPLEMTSTKKIIRPAALESLRKMKDESFLL